MTSHLIFPGALMMSRTNDSMYSSTLLITKSSKAFKSFGRTLNGVGRLTKTLSPLIKSIAGVTLLVKSERCAATSMSYTSPDMNDSRKPAPPVDPRSSFYADGLKNLSKRPLGKLFSRHSLKIRSFDSNKPWRAASCSSCQIRKK